MPSRNRRAAAFAFLFLGEASAGILRHGIETLVFGRKIELPAHGTTIARTTGSGSLPAKGGTEHAFIDSLET
jgi:hypothetical protein